MRLGDLSRKQKEYLKQGLLFEKIENPSWMDLSHCEKIITDKDLEEKYGNTEFSPDDFVI